MRLQIQKIEQKGEELQLQVNEFWFFVCWAWQMWFWAGCIWIPTGERAEQRKPSTVASSIQPHHSLVCQRRQYTVQNLDASTTMTVRSGKLPHLTHNYHNTPYTYNTYCALHFYGPSWSPRRLLHRTLHSESCWPTRFVGNTWFRKTP